MRSTCSPALAIVDGEFFLHRVMHIPEYWEMKTTEGEPSGAVYGILSTIRTSLLKFPGVRRCIVTWDTGHSERRLSIYPKYKGHRGPKKDATEEELLEYTERKRRHQLAKDTFLTGLPLFALRNAFLPCKEGDDIIAWFVSRAKEDVVVITEDRDLLQLVKPNVAVYLPIKDKFIHFQNFEEETGSMKSLFLLGKAIIGDKSDNIDKVPQIGKTRVSRLMEAAGELVRSGEAKTLSSALLKGCEVMQTRDTRGKKAYQTLARSTDIVSRNLDLMDLRREPFTSSEEDSLRRVLLPESGCFHESKAVSWLNVWEMKEFIDNWAEWSRPYRQLV